MVDEGAPNNIYWVDTSLVFSTGAWATSATTGAPANRIAERLPRRTEHAIRNRWHRLQAQAIDARRETGAVCPVDEPGAAWQASQFLSV